MPGGPSPKRPGSIPFLYLLMLAGLVVFSSLVSFLILSRSRAASPGPAAAPSYRDAASTYRILRSFQALPCGVPDPLRDGESSSPLVREAACLRRAAAALTAGDLPAVPPLLAVVADDSPLAKRKDALERQFLFLSGEYQAYELRLAKVGDPDENDRAMAVASRWKQGRDAEAAALFRRCFESDPLWPLVRFVPLRVIARWCAPLTFSAWSAKFDSLLERGTLGELVRELPLAQNSQLACLYQAEIDYRRKAYARSLASLARVRDERLTPRRERLQVKIDLRRGDFQNIIVRVAAFRRWPDLYAELLSDSAAILLGGGEFDLALHFLEQYRDTCPVNSELHWKTDWSIAWILSRQGRLDGALMAFNRGTSSPFSNYRVPALYWQARLLNQPPALEAYPFSYYDAARQPPRATWQAPTLFLKTFAGRPEPRWLDRLESVRTLWQGGYVDEALLEVRRLLRDRPPSSLEWRLATMIEAVLRHRSGRYQAAFLTLRRVFPDIMSLRLPPVFEPLLFPVDFLPKIEEACRAEALDPSLALALIREETFFRPDALSPAGAVGLMQVMPGTARRLGMKLEMADAEQRLTDPQVSARLGCHYLRWLLDRYQGRVYCVLAAYNAGEGRVDEWLARMPNVPEEEFIEMIPFTETRNYVKNILRNRPYYRRILDRTRSRG